MKKRQYENHGMTRMAEYRVWVIMRSRCQNPAVPCYPRYGGRGITVCERWERFSNFIADMGPRPSNRHSIDRIDNDGPYSPENCRWATTKEQCRNQRRNRLITYMGTTAPLAWWAEQIGIRMGTLSFRLCRSGMSIGQALLPKHPRLGHWISKERTDWSDFI